MEIGFSVIIPTMWRSNKTSKLLKDLYESKYIHEIIIIDNDVAAKNVDLDQYSNKIRYYPQTENIYVNPAWNLGVSLANNDLLCICNDDINFNVNDYIQFVLPHISELGIFGANIRPYHKVTQDVLYKINDDRITRAALATQGFGMLMFMNKKNWINIPSSLKIWFGDDWLTGNHENIYSVNLVKTIDADKHTTASSPELKEILKLDRIEWKRLKS
tara:strand:+ start:965 stop:1612 length:648 start_codon:yes stop_codon:yes gene_type:complete